MSRSRRRRLRRANARPASSPKRAFDILLDEEAAFAPVVRYARWLSTLNHHLHVRLQSPLNLHARLADVQAKTLVYLVDSPTWHARLRLSEARLLEAARGLDLEVTTLRIRTTSQSFDPQARAMNAIDARLRSKCGITPAETRALADIRALLSAPREKGAGEEIEQVSPRK